MNNLIKEVAQELNNIDYNDIDDYLRNDISVPLKEKGIVVAFGQSDDLLELRGAIYDEIDCYSPTKAIWLENQFINCNKLDKLYEFLEDECDGFFISQIKKMCENTKYISINPNSKMFQFEYETNFPCEQFNIIEDGEVYGVGFVFDINSLKGES